MEKEGDPSGGWRFAQCFGDKGEVEEITEGKLPFPFAGCRGNVLAVLFGRRRSPCENEDAVELAVSRISLLFRESEPIH